MTPLPFVHLPDLLGASRGIVVAILVTGITLLIVGIVLSLAGNVFERIQAARIGSHARARSMWRLISYVVWFAASVGIVVAFAGNLAIAALGLGLLGAAIAFVLQRALLNVIGWAAITYQGIYHIGDRVSIGEVKGYIMDVRLMHTELREFGGWMAGDMFTGRIVVVPNAQVFDTAVYNYTKDIPFVWDEVECLVTYESDVEPAKKYMLEAARAVVGDSMAQPHEDFLAHLEIRDLEGMMLRGPEIPMAFADSGVRLYVLFFCPIEARWRTKSQIYERIWTKFMADPPVEITYPHLQVVRRERELAGADADL